MAAELPPFPELVPARMINEYVYCPRLAYLEWVQREWADNADTVEGRWGHRRVDTHEHLLARADREDVPTPVRSVTLSSDEEGLIARIDLLEFDEDSRNAVPVDYKRGKPPNNPEQSWLPERVQLCIQALLLRRAGWSCTHGIIYYTGARRRVRVDITEGLVKQTREAVRELRQTCASGRIPPPLVNSPKCPRCSLVNICLPDEINYLSRNDPAVKERRLIPMRTDAMPLYVQQHGLTVGVNGEVLVIREAGDKIGESRLIDTSQVCLMGNVQITTQAIHALARRGIPVCYFTHGGWFHAITTPMSHKNVELRQHQYRAAFDPEKSLSLARRFVAAKIRNQRTLLRRNHKSLSRYVPDELKRLSNAAARARNPGELRGIEGLAARLYFSYFQGMLKVPPHRIGTFAFTERNRRPPRDPVNALLSYAYSLLAKEMTVVCLATGFDPYQGLYHQARYGRPSLALDLMEEFRPLVADSVVLWAINNGVLSQTDFDTTGYGVALRQAGRRNFLRAYERRLDESITHPVFRYRISYRRVLHVQARLLARHLAGEIPEYPPFLTR